MRTSVKRTIAKRTIGERTVGRTGRRTVVLTLSIVLVVAQAVDLVWPRDDVRTGSPASTAAAAALMFLLALYPDGRFVPRWTAVVAPVGVVVFAWSGGVGPDAAAAVLWPLPMLPVVLALIGALAYRYLRRATVAERETVRWPLLGLLLLATLTIPTDLIAVAMTGANLAPVPALSAVLQLAFLLPGVGFVVGLVAPRTDLVDRLLAIWLAVVVAAAALGAVFALGFVLTGLWVQPPWPAWIGAAMVALAAVWVLPLARRIGRHVVFRGRTDRLRAVAILHRHIGDALDGGEIPGEVAAAVRTATGSALVVLRRSGHVGTWAISGDEQVDATASVTVPVTHLGLPVATIDIHPRPAESEVSAADRRIVEAMADAAAPALHSARLSSAFPELTDRERQVLSGIVRGLPNRAIAERLGVSSKTVANYVSIVLTKLRVPDRERAAELARRRTADLA